MKVYGVIGWKNSGKTSLMERLVAEITARGFSVSTVKHVHHDVDLDQPGKDTYRHRQAGAREVVLASKDRFALMVEHRGPEPDLAAVLARLAPVDLVLVEGYKRDRHRKLEVWRRETGQDLIQTGDPLVRAVATDAPGLSLPVPVLDLNDTAAVADFILAEVGLTAQRFDTVAIVDWSASNGPSPAKPSADAIWIGTASATGTEARYFRTRAEAEAHLAALMDTEQAAGRRLLIGFDFPMGYPKGFAARLTGQGDPRALWHWLADRITDDGNRNNRFAVADAINASIGKGPFWGRPARLPLPHLPERKAVDYPALALPERRAVERQVPRAQPVWKLYTTGSVGSQALMGLPMIHRLSRRPGVAVWPFDPPARAPAVLAEVYPSLLAPLVAQQPGIKDAAQVTLLARALHRLSQEGALDPLLALPDIADIAEEGWILGAGHEAALLQAAAA
ncbi:molybdopterin-guanine dinucleotide biosynthesis protein B [Tabrizicola sp. TH137]|uniref:molybdopterin-guanine dinucleotide biosynthesis protein B n=1 Tax=Tabrizicola sp. TH137 TaxID=2067452 RepID=UPI000C7B356E|nr:molybdopterin-guanine dinucleotide biosynthesis protein B [Tabrizicola sp. TH137]PLL14340.1 molybdopterin-guanine dinucleotide biosynthesis protein B [Tabrizicola sp. TH137]